MNIPKAVTALSVDIRNLTHRKQQKVRELLSAAFQPSGVQV